jgi:hypothetical protein
MMASSSPRSFEPAFRDAVTDCVARLELCDRNLITFHYVHGVGVDQLCEMFSMPRTGMVRQLARIRERELRDLRRSLAARQPLDGNEISDEIDRLLELARRRFDHVIARVLRA